MPFFDLSERNCRLPATSRERLYYTDAIRFESMYIIARCSYCGLRSSMPGGRWISGNLVCEPCAVDHGAPRMCEDDAVWQACLAVPRPTCWTDAPDAVPPPPGNSARCFTGSQQPQPTVRTSRLIGTGFRKAVALPLP